MKLKNVALVIAVLLLLVFAYQPAEAGVNINIDLPFFSLPYPPQLVVIPGTYAYYVADADVDIVFYQGRWYRPWNDRWYWATGYNGPWALAGPRFVPNILLRLPRDYRHGREYTRIPYYDLNRNWRRWERDRRWDRGHDWWQKGRDEHRFDRDRRDGRDNRYRQDDRRDMRDRGNLKRDQMQMHQQQQRPEGRQGSRQNKQSEKWYRDQNREGRDDQRGRQ
jgi:hypothetical protein